MLWSRSLTDWNRLSPLLRRMSGLSSLPSYSIWFELVLCPFILTIDSGDPSVARLVTFWMDESSRQEGEYGDNYWTLTFSNVSLLALISFIGVFRSEASWDVAPKSFVESSLNRVWKAFGDMFEAEARELSGSMMISVRLRFLVWNDALLSYPTVVGCRSLIPLNPSTIRSFLTYWRASFLAFFFVFLTSLIREHGHFFPIRMLAYETCGSVVADETVFRRLIPSAYNCA